MRNTKIPLHIKQAAYAEYKKGYKVVDILKKYDICFGTLYSYIHKQEEIAKTFHDNDEQTSKPKTNKQKKTKKPENVKHKQNGGYNNDTSILSIDDALLELANL